MEIVTILLSIVVAGAIGAIIGVFIHNQQLKRDIASAGNEAERIRSEAEDQRKVFISDAREEANRIRKGADDDIKDRRRELQRLESRLSNREENLDNRQDRLQLREETLGDRERSAEEREAELESDREQLQELKDERIKVLESVASLTMAEAKDDIMNAAEEEMRFDLNKRYYELELETKDRADEKAKEIISMAVQRIAADVVSESTTSLVPLPNDEM